MNAWIFLDTIKREHDINVTVYNKKGYAVRAPGKIDTVQDNHIVKVLGTVNAKIETRIVKNTYISVVPLVNKPECGFCHKAENGKKFIGAMIFKRSFNPFIYYSMERIILFSVISMVLIGFLIILIKWDPERNIKELFDKTK